MGFQFAPQNNAHVALHVDDVAAAKAELEGKGVEFLGDVFDTGVCHMAFFKDPDGNDLMLHHRYAPAHRLTNRSCRRVSLPELGVKRDRQQVALPARRPGGLRATRGSRRRRRARRSTARG